MLPFLLLGPNMLPVPYSENNYTVFDLISLEKELKLQTENLSNLETLKEEVLEITSSENASLIAESESFKAKLIDLEGDYKDILSRKNKTDPKMEEPEEDKPKLSSKQKKILSKIFRKIALLCHPDKVGNSGLVTLYQSAKEAYEAGDLQGLKDILELAQDKGKRADHIVEQNKKNSQKVDLDTQIETVKSSIQDILLQIENIEQDEFYSVMTIYMMKGARFSVKFHVSVLEETIRFYKKEIKEIETKIKLLNRNFEEFDFDMPSEKDEIKYDDPFFFGDN